MGDYFVRLVQMPYKVKGVTTRNDDGTFNIFINSIIPENQQRDALEHELDHIDDDDFFNDAPACEIEGRNNVSA